MLHLITPPQGEVVSVADIKAHLRVDHSDEDGLIEAIRDAAVAHLDGRDGWLGRALLSQTWELRLKDFDCHREIELPLPPLIEVEQITYYDADNASQTLSDSVYAVSGAGAGSKARVLLAYGQSWPAVYDRADAVAIRYRAGYVDTDGSPTEGVIPKPIIAAIKLYCGTLYAHRETVVVGQTAVALPWAAEQLLQPYRVW